MKKQKPYKDKVELAFAILSLALVIVSVTMIFIGKAYMGL